MGAKLKKNVRRILVILICILILLSMVNITGISLKVSYDGKYIAITIPLESPNQWLSSIHVLQVIVIDTVEKKKSIITTTTRRDFRGIYWEHGTYDLWLDGDYGIICYRFLNGIWTEYSLIKDQNNQNLLVNGKDEEEIDISQLPKDIVRRIKALSN